MTNKNLIIRTILLILGILIIFLFVKIGKLTPFEPMEQNETFPKNISFNILIEGKNSNILQNQTKIITNAQDWSSLWEKMFPTEKISSAIDFNRKNLIAVFQGQKPTGGHSIEIIKILEYENYIEITLKETSPGKDCIVATLITSPYHVIETSKIAKEVKFIIQQETLECK